MTKENDVFTSLSRQEWHRRGGAGNDDMALVIGCLQRIAESYERNTEQVYNFGARIANLEKENRSLKTKIRKLEKATERKVTAPEELPNGFSESQK